MNIVLAVINYFIIILLSVVLQLYLSKRKSKMLGLILPLLSFLYLVSISLGIISMPRPGTYKNYDVVYGNLLSEVIIEPFHINYTSIFLMLLAFVAPLIIYLFIYFNQRKKINKSLNVE